jgi:hypothetical protein
MDQEDIYILYKTSLALAICLLLVQLFYLPIASQKGPKWFMDLDKDRAEALDKVNLSRSLSLHEKDISEQEYSEKENKIANKQKI